MSAAATSDTSNGRKYIAVHKLRACMLRSRWRPSATISAERAGTDMMSGPTVVAAACPPRPQRMGESAGAVKASTCGHAGCVHIIQPPMGIAPAQTATAPPIDRSAYKFTLASTRAMLAAAGLRLDAGHTDAGARFALALAAPTSRAVAARARRAA